MTNNRVCEACGDGFWQGRGRPAKRCPTCRAGDRYGPAHRALAASSSQAVGRLCTRCGRPILAGQAVSPDHLDGGGPNDYAGWAHASCNHSAGASRGNRLRAAAYRALKAGLAGQAIAALEAPPPEPPPSPRSRRW